jgi:hypothetical protein
MPTPASKSHSLHDEQQHQRDGIDPDAFPPLDGCRLFRELRGWLMSVSVSGVLFPGVTAGSAGGSTDGAGRTMPLSSTPQAHRTEDGARRALQAGQCRNDSIAQSNRLEDEGRPLGEVRERPSSKK